MIDKPWDYDRFAHEMRLAGWEYIRPGIYRHKQTLAEFNAYGWSKARVARYGTGEAWVEFAALHALPTEAPF